MELRQLEHFVAVVDEQHFTRAARRCHMSQSALSASIRALEKEFDTPLFVRTTRRVEVTDAGRALVDKARLILDALATAREAVNATTGLLSGVLHLGGTQIACTGDQAALLAELRAAHPDVEIRYSCGTSPSLVDDVRVGQLDAAFVGVPSRTPPGVVIRPLTTFPIVLICPPDHPLAGRERVAIDELRNERFVGWPVDSLANGALDDVMRALGRDRRVPVEVDDAATMLEFVAHGLGVALMPSYLAAERPPLVAVPIDDPSLVWHVGIATSKTNVNQLTSALLDMIDLMQAGVETRDRLALLGG